MGEETYERTRRKMDYNVSWNGCAAVAILKRGQLMMNTVLPEDQMAME